MRKLTALLLIVGIVGAGIALYLYLTRRRTDENDVVEPSTLKGNEWILSDALQASQLSSLTTQLLDKVDRSALTSLISRADVESQLADKQTQIDALTQLVQTLQSGQSSSTGAIRYDQPMSLTDAQKSQVRSSIGALQDEDLSYNLDA